MQIPEKSWLTTGLKKPVVLLVLHVTLPVGLEPDTVAVQLIGEMADAGLGEQKTAVEVAPADTIGAYIERS